MLFLGSVKEMEGSSTKSANEIGPISSSEANTEETSEKLKLIGFWNRLFLLYLFSFTRTLVHVNSLTNRLM